MIAATVSLGGTGEPAASLTRAEGSGRLPGKASRSRVWTGE